MVGDLTPFRPGGGVVVRASLRVVAWAAFRVGPLLGYWGFPVRLFLPAWHAFWGGLRGAAGSWYGARTNQPTAGRPLGLAERGRTSHV